MIARDNIRKTTSRFSMYQTDRLFVACSRSAHNGKEPDVT
jgi:hypothetical protein